MAQLPQLKSDRCRTDLLHIVAIGVLSCALAKLDVGAILRQHEVGTELLPQARVHLIVYPAKLPLSAAGTAPVGIAPLSEMIRSMTVGLSICPVVTTWLMVPITLGFCGVSRNSSVGLVGLARNAAEKLAGESLSSPAARLFGRIVTLGW